MIIIDDRNLPQQSEKLEIVNRFEPRGITHAMHDIDGTHSLIRNWAPVMSICLHYASHYNIDDDFDSESKKQWLIDNAGRKPLPETDRFCVESAGFSAITQMEWAIRLGFQSGNVRIPDYEFTEKDIRLNDLIIKRIWGGQEISDDIEEAAAIKKFLSRYVPRLFRLYEDILNRACRNSNLAMARENPDEWLVPGSFEFVEMLYQSGVKNYFVTGGVVGKNDHCKIMGIHEEILALGYEIGPGKMFEGIFGSCWDKKITKTEVIQQLIDSLDIRKENLLIIGDGRAEIQAARTMGAVAISRLAEDSQRQRQIHRELGTNYIVPDYTGENFRKLFSPE